MLNYVKSLRNRIQLIGRLGKDPEVRYLESGVAVANFPIATSESFKDKNTRERREITDWHNIVLWRGLAEVAEKYLKKGMKVYVEGKLKTRSWTDENNQTRYTTEVVADQMTMLSRAEGGNESAQNYPPTVEKTETKPIDQDVSPEDDDDAVSVTFVEKLREAAQNLRPLLRKNRHVAIDFNQGWIARPGANGISAKPTIETLWTAALAMSAAKGVRNTIMNFGHGKLPRFMPVVSFTGEDMFIRGHNDHNDSRQGEGVRTVQLNLLSATEEQLFRDTFNIDADHVRRLFSNEVVSS